MAINCVHIESDAYMVCLAHALSTEKEEVMGLLIGEIDENRISHISAVIMLRRSDKQPDRVEISPEQLSDASTAAENLAKELQRPMRVLGWYHSHPHITVWPSHVDVRTQAMYQMMDEGFIGLIFSVFNQDKTSKQSRIQVTCFQSINQSPESEQPQYMRLEIPLHIMRLDSMGKACLDSLTELPRILSQEEEDEYHRSNQDKKLDLISKIYNGSVYTRSICHIMEVMSGPLMQSLESRLERNHNKVAGLLLEKEKLQRHLEKIESDELKLKLEPSPAKEDTLREYESNM